MEHLLSRRAAGATSSAIRDLLRLVERPGVLSLAGGLPAPDAFPVERIRLAADRALATGGRYGVAALQYGPTEGDDELRSLAATRIGARADEVLVTTGSQQGLDLVARALVDPGDVVVVEAPSYLGALQAFRACEPVFAEVETDAHGMRTDELERLLASGLRPKLLYTVPNFQNPSGATMPVERRRHLAALADRFGFVIVEDDPYGVLRFRGEHLPSVRTFSERVVTLGTASKLLAPGLRVAWLAAPEWLFGSLVRLKQAADLHTSTLAQRIAADVLGDHEFLAAHVRRIGAIYRARCDALADAVAESVEVVVPDGGMFLWGRVRADGIDTTELLPRALELGVAFVPGSAFHVGDGGRSSLRLSFSTLTPPELGEAAGRLAASISAARRAAAAPALRPASAAPAVRPVVLSR
ncbi:MAG: PLP-dependent aminotransferase family protein [Acidimicrobiia bacterium]